MIIIIISSHVNCLGTESTLQDCPHPGFNISFSEGYDLYGPVPYDRNGESLAACQDHSTDAAVRCFNGGENCRCLVVHLVKLIIFFFLKIVMVFFLSSIIVTAISLELVNG